MPKVHSTRKNFGNKHPNYLSIAVNSRKTRVENQKKILEKINDLLKLYLNYYKTQLGIENSNNNSNNSNNNSGYGNQGNQELQMELENLFLGIREQLDPKEENPEDGLYDYIKNIADYIDKHIDNKTAIPTNKIKQLIVVKKMLHKHIKPILHALHDDKDDHKKVVNMMDDIEDDPMGNLVGLMKKVSVGGTRKQRKH